MHNLQYVFRDTSRCNILSFVVPRCRLSDVLPVLRQHLVECIPSVFEAAVDHLHFCCYSLILRVTSHYDVEMTEPILVDLSIHIVLPKILAQLVR